MTGPPTVWLLPHVSLDGESVRTVRALLADGAAAGWWQLADGDVEACGQPSVRVVPDVGSVDAAIPCTLWVVRDPAGPGDRAVPGPAADDEASLAPPPGAPVVVQLAELTPAMLRATIALLDQVRVLRDVVADEQARYELLVEAADVGDWDMDIRRNRTRRSLKHDMLLGYRELLPSWGYDDFLAHVHPEDRARVDAAYQRALAGEGRYDVEFRTTWPDGSLHWIASRGRFVLGPSGTPLRAAGVMSDITDRKEAELRLTELAREESVGRVAAGIAHDFNNQLTVILGTTSLLLDEPDISRGVRDELTRVMAAAEGSAQLIRGLLSLSRHVTPRIDVLDLTALLEDLRSSIERVVGPGVAVLLDLPADGLPVLGDRLQLENVFLNLAANARDAMPAGGDLTITGAVIDHDVRVSLADSGEGMDESTRERCFDMFYTTKPVGRGTGLGLASVKRTLEAMRGTVELTSALGAGTTVRLTMPTATPAPAHPEASASAFPAARSGGHRILLVDDDEAVRLIAARVLRAAGYEVVTAARGEEAVAHAISDGRFDVLITDLIMPTMGGRAVAEAVLERQPATRVLLMSGYSDDDIAQYGIDRGTYAFLSKPFTVSMLLERVAALLSSATEAERRSR